MTKTPDPEFVKFFAGDWQTLLERVEVPGWEKPLSWDRRAAYLLWQLAHDDLDLTDIEGVLRYVATGNVNAPAPVGRPFNHTDFDAITHTPEGVILSFNANEVAQ